MRKLWKKRTAFLNDAEIKKRSFSHERCMTKKTFYARGIDNKAFLSYNETIFIGSIRAR